MNAPETPFERYVRLREELGYAAAAEAAANAAYEQGRARWQKEHPEVPP